MTAAKIAFIGTHGVGKTILTFTVAGELRKRSLDADVAYENSRHSPYPINEATTLDGQMWILATQWKTELEASLRSKIVICDRAVVDNYAYMVRACGPQPALTPFIREWSRSYAALFMVPMIDRGIVADRKRALSTTFQREIHTILEGLIDSFELRDRVVALSADRDRHLTEVLEALRRRRIVERTLFD